MPLQLLVTFMIRRTNTKVLCKLQESPKNKKKIECYIHKTLVESILSIEKRHIQVFLIFF